MAHVDWVHMEKRHSHRVGLANISYRQSREKRTGKKNGSFDLFDLEAFRLIRRSSEKSTWPGPSVPWLVLQGKQMVMCIIYYMK